MRQSSLHKSPFSVLRVTTRDNRHKILEQAEQRSLEIDHGECQKARSDLTNPRLRLAAETSWLPGVSPSRSNALVAKLTQDPIDIRNETGVTALAKLNLLSSSLEVLEPVLSDEDVRDLILEMADLADQLSSEEVQREINEDRAVSGFPPVTSLDAIEEELAARKRCYRDVIKGYLNGMKSTALISVMTQIADQATAHGVVHAPDLVDQLIDSYEVETAKFLEDEAANAERLIDAIRAAATDGESSIKPKIDRLVAVVGNWDYVAQPIQLGAKARGLEHVPSRDLAFSVRSLAIDLFNNHDFLASTKQLSELLLHHFSEVPEVFDHLAEDKEALDRIARQQRTAELTTPVREMCERAIKSCDNMPETAYETATQLWKSAQPLLSDLEKKGVASDQLAVARNYVAVALLRGAIAYSSATEKWKPSIGLLETALSLASDADLRVQIEKNLAVVRDNERLLGDLKPMSGSPRLYTVNGVGTTLYGSSDVDPSSGSYITTLYFVFVFLPIFPLARYRVIQSSSSYRFLGKARLRSFDKWHIGVSLVAIAILVLANL